MDTITAKQELQLKELEIQELKKYITEMQKCLFEASDLALKVANEKDLPELGSFIYQLKQLSKIKTESIAQRQFFLNRKIQAVIDLKPGHTNPRSIYF